jgi:glucosylceramidase
MMLKKLLIRPVLCPALLVFMAAACGKAQKQSAPPPSSLPDTSSVKSNVTLWLTKADKSVLFRKQDGTLPFSGNAGNNPVITLDTAQTYQSMDGFGFCLTGGSAYLIHRLPQEQRKALLQELFSTEGTSIGISYLRISIGASDLSRTVFSYDDRPAGQTDTTLQYFDLGPDKEDLIPLLQEILAINPDIKILGSPWSAPAWMKDNNSTKGGSLDTAYYGAYASYLVKYVQAMKENGIHISAITPQNEPLNPKNNPSMVMQAAEQETFIKNNLGPAFRAAGLDTRIIVYDHNCDRPDYPLTILRDTAAAKFVDGSAFHLYAGDISALSQVHDAYPEKNVYFTEQWTGGPGNFAGDLDWHVKNLIIGAPRNWSRNVLEWNLAADPEYQPHTPGGCTTCMGALTIGSDVTRNVSYYIIASAAKFVRPGAVRIASNVINNLQNVAFRNTDGSKVLIVLNDSDDRQDFSIRLGEKMVTASLHGKAVGTFVWP